MKEFKYVLTDKEGIHARPAGELVKKANSFTSQITMLKGEKQADVKGIFAVMGLGVKCGEEVRITAEGADEVQAIEAIKAFMKENL